MEEKRHCLQCGKEIPSWKKFCNSSCAATYNNLRKGKGTIHWSEEKRKAFSERQLKRKGSLPLDQREYKCRYCGEKIDYDPTHKFLWHTVCRKCAHYGHSIKLYVRTGFTEGPLKDRDKKLEDLFRNLYLEQGWSVPQIAKEFNLYYETIRIFFKNHNIQERGLSEAVQNSIFKGIRKPATGDSKYKHGFHVSWEGKKFWYRSSYELEFAQMLDEQKVRYEIESRSCRTYYIDPVDNREHVAVPDFYLPDTNELIEVKSTFTLGNKDTMKAKLLAYRDAGYVPKLWLDKKFVDLDTF